MIDVTVFTVQESQSYADENSLLFMETSAKTAMNVNEMFLAIGELTISQSLSIPIRQLYRLVGI